VGRNFDGGKREFLTKTSISEWYLEERVLKGVRVAEINGMGERGGTAKRKLNPIRGGAEGAESSVVRVQLLWRKSKRE